MFQTGNHITFDSLEAFIASGDKLTIGREAVQRIEKSFEYLRQKINNSTDSFYGINTGFGSLYNTKISNADLTTLQENLLKSHACGMGDEVPRDIVRLMLILKAQSLAYGHSGVQLQTVQRLVDFYNLGITPVVYEQGSLGASGDLAPLAHLCLPLIGLGEVWINDQKITAAEALKQHNLAPVILQAKEGLALINGTQFMAAYGVHCILKYRRLYAKANLIAAMSIDAFDGRIEPFLPYSHAIRPHDGQRLVAETVFNLLQGSAIITQTKQHVQDPYSFRCIPQVHGASWDVLQHVEKTFLTEINAVTDNPNIFPDEDLILSAGNFHGQPLAMQLDFLGIAAAELASISERRTYKLISGERGLPAFLVKNPGLNSGFMIPQYTAASIVSQNKQLATPASVDSIISSNGQEDHVSMGANAATKCKRIVDNLESVLAIELLNACQALDFRRPLKSSDVVETLYKKVRTAVPFMEEDVYLHDAIKRCAGFI